MESDDEEVVAVAATILLLSKNKKKRKRRYWVHPYNDINLKHSTYLVAKELNNHPAKFQSFYRMSIQTFTKLCSIVGPSLKKKDTNFRMCLSVEEKVLITLRYGYKQKRWISGKIFFSRTPAKEIIAMLEIVHNTVLHPRTLKRLLHKLQLYRRKNCTEFGYVLSFIKDQLDKSGQLHGYRWMHLKCIQHGLVVTQHAVRKALLLLDQEGVEIRRRKRLRRRRYTNAGPNAVWHIDSYDKLKRYGICTNGAIDGFSRYIIWLHAGRTSSDPQVIAGYYISAVRRLGLSPQTVRADMGTENGTVASIQTALRQVFGNSASLKPPFIYGKSTANQRIECWWSNLRKQNSQFWINLFEILDEESMFNGSQLDKSLIQLCFLRIIQDDLDSVVKVWNAHRIRGTRSNRLYLGKPMIMYEAPILYAVEDQSMTVGETVIQCLEQECIFYNNTCTESVEELCRCVMTENNLPTIISNPYEAVKLYVELRTIIYQLLEQI